MRTRFESVFSAPTASQVEDAVVQTVAYADVFDYPLQAMEVHRYLHGVSASAEATTAALARRSGPGGTLRVSGGFYTLRGREGLGEVRQRRAAVADRLWPTAVAYGHLIASLPFVHMVAVTGSLAWHNVDPSPAHGRPPDIDYLIVAEPGRVWSCRWFVAALARAARLRGVAICPNYVISARALVLGDRNLYTAYELARTTPITGLRTYCRLRVANRWVEAYLPHAGEPRVPERHASPRPHRLGAMLRAISPLVERSLRSSAGARLERWEMHYRMWKRARDLRERGEAAYSADWYKEHFRNHARTSLVAFADRLRTLEVPARSSTAD